MRNIKRLLPVAFVLLLALAPGLSCSNKTRNPLQPLILVQLPTIPKADTIRKKKITSSQDRQRLLDSFYVYGYNKYYGPQFDGLRKSILNLSTTNKGQGESIINLTDIIGSMRARSIKRSDSISNILELYQRENLKLNKEILALNKQKLAAESEQIESNKKQIESSNKIIRWLMSAMIIIFLLIFTLSGLGYAFYRYVKNEFKSIKHG